MKSRPARRPQAGDAHDESHRPRRVGQVIGWVIPSGLSARSRLSAARARAYAGHRVELSPSAEPARSGQLSSPNTLACVPSARRVAGEGRRRHRSNPWAQEETLSASNWTRSAPTEIVATAIANQLLTAKSAEAHPANPRRRPWTGVFSGSRRMVVAGQSTRRSWRGDRCRKCFRWSAMGERSFR
jgi:hypothetical protein